MRESHEIGSQVLVFETPHNRSRSEFGEAGVFARLGTVEEETTPKPQVWNPTHFNPETGYHGRYEEGEPSGPRMYRVVFEDGSVENVDVHRLMLPGEAAPTIGPAELAARRAADAEYQAALARANRQADEERRRAADAEQQQAVARALHQQ